MGRKEELIQHITKSYLPKGEGIALGGAILKA
jgi:hypothetical protein